MSEGEYRLGSSDEHERNRPPLQGEVIDAMTAFDKRLQGSDVLECVAVTTQFQRGDLVINTQARKNYGAVEAEAEASDELHVSVTRRGVDGLGLTVSTPDERGRTVVCVNGEYLGASCAATGPLSALGIGYAMFLARAHRTGELTYKPQDGEQVSLVDFDEALQDMLWTDDPLSTLTFRHFEAAANLKMSNTRIVERFLRDLHASKVPILRHIVTTKELPGDLKDQHDRKLGATHRIVTEVGVHGAATFEDTRTIEIHSKEQHQLTDRIGRPVPAERITYLRLMEGSAPTLDVVTTHVLIPTIGADGSRGFSLAAFKEHTQNKPDAQRTTADATAGQLRDAIESLQLAHSS